MDSSLLGLHHGLARWRGPSSLPVSLHVPAANSRKDTPMSSLELCGSFFIVFPTFTQSVHYLAHRQSVKHRYGCATFLTTLQRGTPAFGLEGSPLLACLFSPQFLLLPPTPLPCPTLSLLSPPPPQLSPALSCPSGYLHMHISHQNRLPFL